MGITNTPGHFALGTKGVMKMLGYRFTEWLKSHYAKAKEKAQAFENCRAKAVDIDKRLRGLS